MGQPACLRKGGVENHHDDEAPDQAASRKMLVTLAVRFGNDLVADDEQHGASRHCQAPRQQTRRKTHHRSAKHGSQNEFSQR